MSEKSEAAEADRRPSHPDRLPVCAPPPHVPMTSDIPAEWREGRYVTLTVGGDVDMSETHPTDANPEARG